MTEDEKRFLLKWFVRRMIFNSLPFALIGLAIGGSRGYLEIGLAVLLAGLFVWRYLIDVLDGKAQCVCGHARTLQKRVIGPAHYYIVVDQIQIRVSKETWTTFSPTRKYMVVYSPRSKWLLRHKVVPSCPK